MEKEEAEKLREKAAENLAGEVHGEIEDEADESLERGEEGFEVDANQEIEGGCLYKLWTEIKAWLPPPTG